MKKIIAIVTVLLTCFTTLLSQEADNTKTRTESATFKNKQFENFLSTLLNINAEAPAGAVYVDLSKDPLIKLNVPLRKIDAKKNYFAFFESRFASTNNYIPVLKKGKWQPDIDLLFSQTWMPVRKRWFYKKDIEAYESINGKKKGEGIRLMPINEASMVKFAWINLKTGFNFKKFGFFDDQTNTQYDDRVYERNTTNFLIKISGNLYIMKRGAGKTSKIGFYSNLGYELNTEDNNYTTLEKTSIKIKQTYTDGNGELYEETKDELDLRKGEFKTGTSHTFPFITTLIFNPGNIDFNLNFYGKHRVFQNTNTTDLGVSLFFPIPKDDEGKSSINIGIKFDLLDVRNQINNSSFKEKIKFGIALAVPIVPSLKSDPK